MKPRVVIKLYALVLLIIFGGIVLHAPLSVGFGTLFPQFDLLIKSWKEILMVIAAGLGVAVVTEKRAWRELASDRIIQAVVAFSLLHVLVAASMINGVQATAAGLMIDLRFVAYFVLVYTLIKLAPEYRRRFVQVGAVGAAVVIGFAVAQLFLPADILTHIGYGEATIQPYLTVDKNPDFIRINSTLRGPNPLGAYAGIVIGLLTALAVRARRYAYSRRQVIVGALLAVGCVVALWSSYSRSALLAAGLTVFLVILIEERRFISRQAWIIGSVVLFALIGGLFLGRNTPLVTNVILHENRDGGSLTTSNDGHVESLITGTEKMLRQPIGAGIGSTGSASLMTDAPLIIENQYLFIAHEVGWFGLVLLLVIMGLLLTRLWGYRRDWLSLGVLASGVGLNCIGLLLPVWADDTVSIIWWGLAGAAVASGEKYARQSTK